MTTIYVALAALSFLSLFNFFFTLYFAKKMDVVQSVKLDVMKLKNPQKFFKLDVVENVEDSMRDTKFCVTKVIFQENVGWVYELSKISNPDYIIWSNGGGGVKKSETQGFKQSKK